MPFSHLGPAVTDRDAWGGARSDAREAGIVAAMDERLCLLQVHAHPDDEASKGAGTQAKYRDQGVRGVLVTCTGGEEGDILNPEMESPEIAANLHEIRMAELDRSVEILGYDKLHLLGYRDSGMPDSEGNKNPANFANAELDEAVDRFARILRAEQPQVVITYAEDQKRYPHPDHLRVYEITRPAIARAADAAWDATAGDPWQVQKIYYANTFSRERMLKVHAWFEEQGEESPFEEWLAKVPEDFDAALTTRIGVADYLETARAALLAHRTQVTPDTRWMKIPVDELRKRHPYEDFVLADSLVDSDIPESDLFAGLR